jgi:hypothetical protein
MANLARINYNTELTKLLRKCKTLGITVKFVPDFATRDYVGMNSEAAKELGYPMPHNTIYIDNNLSTEATYHTLKHELDEMTEMKTRGTRYWDAHCHALATEKEPV